MIALECGKGCVSSVSGFLGLKQNQQTGFWNVDFLKAIGKFYCVCNLREIAQIRLINFWNFNCNSV